MNYGQSIIRTIDVFKDLKDAQKALFWIPKYREHFIHSVKVFLLGSLILAELLQDSVLPKCSDIRRSEFAWAAASTFHDIAIPLQDINPLIMELLNRFLQLPESEEVVPNITIANHAIDTRAITYLHFLHTPPNLQEREFLQHMNDLLQEGLINRDLLSYYKRTGDHGIASAIVFLLYSLPQTSSSGDNLFKILKNRFTAEGIINKKTTEEEIKKEFEKECNIYRLIAEAIARHNLTFKNDFPKEAKHKINFNENPILYLLTICDHLQDWGRPANESEKRPFCEVLRVQKSSNEMIEIKIKYCWIVKDEDNKVKHKINIVQCSMASQEIQNKIKPQCKEYIGKEFSDCQDCVNVRMVKEELTKYWLNIIENITSSGKIKIIFCKDNGNEYESGQQIIFNL